VKIHSGLAIRVRRSLGAVNAKVKFDTEGQAGRELWDADLPAIWGNESRLAFVPCASARVCSKQMPARHIVAIDADPRREESGITLRSIDW